MTLVDNDINPPCWLDPSVTVVTSVNGFTGAVTLNIPRQLSELINDAHFITIEEAPVKSVNGMTGHIIINIPTKVSAFQNDAGYLTEETLPPAPGVPSNVSAFENDAGYLTLETLPEAPGIPSNVSAFDNDAGYLTAETLPEPPVTSVNGQTGAVVVKIPTKVSAFTNDAKYITALNAPVLSVNGQKGNVFLAMSQLINDAHYLKVGDLANYCTKQELSQKKDVIQKLEFTADDLTAGVLLKRYNELAFAPPVIFQILDNEGVCVNADSRIVVQWTDQELRVDFRAYAKPLEGTWKLIF